MTDSLKLELDCNVRKVLESPYDVRRKYFISSIAVRIDSTASRGNPNYWKTSDAIACVILS